MKLLDRLHRTSGVISAIEDVSGLTVRVELKAAPLVFKMMGVRVPVSMILIADYECRDEETGRIAIEVVR